MANINTFHLVITRTKRPVKLAFFCFVICLLNACGQSPEDSARSIDALKEKQNGKVYPSLHLVGNTMGTTYSVKVALDEQADQQRLQAEYQTNVDLILASVNQQMSTYISDSELSQVNKASVGKKIAISEPLAHVLDVSLEVFRKTSGAFDVTVGPLVNVWGFGSEEVDAPPTEEALAAVRGRVGMYYLLVDDDRRLTKHKNIYIDLSAIAKGYAADVIAKFLEDSGQRDYMVEIGGELYIKGHNPLGKPWTIGVEKPTLGRSGTVQTVSGSDIAIATSGDYRNYYESEGKRISHTIDPNSGKPIEHNLASVTVITHSTAHADAYATGLNVLGPEKGLKLADELDLAAYFIIRDKDGFRVEYTDQFKMYMVDL